MDKIRIALILAIACLVTPFVGLEIHRMIMIRESKMYDFVFNRPVVPVQIEIIRGKPFVNSVGMRFVNIPAGSFSMGSPTDELGRHEAEFQHEVVISQAFYLQTTEVTQRQWQTVMEKNPSEFQGENLPMQNISWNDIVKFIKRLNQLEGDTQYRLPSEAEWEYTCRAGSQSAFATGNLTLPVSSLDPNLDRLGWYELNSGEKPHKVATKAANRWGLYDMHGNVWEWNQDRYGGYPKFSRNGITDPTGPLTGRSRVFRGGGWLSAAKHQRCARRMRSLPRFKSSAVGFRVARSE